jgi:hypothetical protein
VVESRALEFMTYDVISQGLEIGRNFSFDRFDGDGRRSRTIKDHRVESVRVSIIVVGIFSFGLQK